MKKCKDCEAILPLDEFHRHKISKDGRRNVCKGCAKRYFSDYYKKNREKHIETCKAWNRKNNPSIMKHQKNRRLAHREYEDPSKQEKIIYAKNTLSFAVFNGEIEKPSCCSVCKRESELEGFHHDYSKPLEVIWVCAYCRNWIDKQKKKALKMEIAEA